jgi:DNA-binding transcriptional ArsR family regulator
MVSSEQRLDAVFSALADPTRRRIVERLAKGPLTVGEIASGFSISQPGISKHVRILEESGLIERRVNGRVHRCTIGPGAMRTVSDWVGRQQRFWNAVLDRLGETLDESPKRRRKR